ncbi:unnamed protein product [Trichobilharzia regenti]|nr:unnamed protein product [Trichobilharzia regenti]
MSTEEEQRSVLLKNDDEESALAEEAWRPVLSCSCPKVYVWRVEKFKIRPVNEKDYGHFFNGDSYIVLNVYRDHRGLGYDVHFWIGSKSTQDEYATAAYKTVELDALLDDQAVQHREVEHYESKLFKSYFPSFRILNGGIDSGFRRVTPNEYQPRLLHFHQDGKAHCEVQEVELSINSLDSTDVFILDLGTKLYQWNGSKSNKEERYNVRQFHAEFMKTLACNAFFTVSVHETAILLILNRNRGSGRRLSALKRNTK